MLETSLVRSASTSFLVVWWQMYLKSQLCHWLWNCFETFGTLGFYQTEVVFRRIMPCFLQVGQRTEFCPTTRRRTRSHRSTSRPVSCQMFGTEVGCSWCYSSRGQVTPAPNICCVNMLIRSQAVNTRRNQKEPCNIDKIMYTSIPYSQNLCEGVLGSAVEPPDTRSDSCCIQRWARVSDTCTVTPGKDSFSTVRERELTRFTQHLNGLVDDIHQMLDTHHNPQQSANNQHPVSRIDCKLPYTLCPSFRSVFLKSVSSTTCRSHFAPKALLNWCACTINNTNAKFRANKHFVKS